MSHVSFRSLLPGVWSQKMVECTLGSGSGSETNLPQDLLLLDDTRQQAVRPGVPGLQRLPGDHPWRKCFAERTLCGREGFRGRERCVFPHMSGGRGKGGREEQAQRPSTALQSLFSTLALYLVSNTSPGKRKHFSGQSWGSIIPSCCDLH